MMRPDYAVWYFESGLCEVCLLGAVMSAKMFDQASGAMIHLHDLDLSPEQQAAPYPQLELMAGRLLETALAMRDKPPELDGFGVMLRPLKDGFWAAGLVPAQGEVVSLWTTPQMSARAAVEALARIADIAEASDMIAREIEQGDAPEQ